MVAPNHGRRLFERMAFSICALTLVGIAAVARAEAPDTASAYEAAVSADEPVCWWRMTRAGGEAVLNRCSMAGDAALVAEPVGEVKLDAAGPSGEEFPDFGADNRAARLAPGPNYLRVSDPGADSPLDFDNGDAITIEAWILPDNNPKPSYSYIVGKGRTAGRRNQNYSLRLFNRGQSGHLSFFFVDAETPDTSPDHAADGHRWTSTAGIPLDGRWHHVALAYTFGRPELIRGYIDGSAVKGKWELGGATRKRPIVDDDELWIGSSLSGRATFAGAIDEVAIYRRALEPAAVARHVTIHRRDEMLALVEEVADSAPADRVQYDVYEGVAPAYRWDFAATERQTLYESDVMALVELPRKYDRRGVIVDHPSPILVHAYARLALPRGKHRLALRSLNAARLYVDDRLLAENPFLPVSPNGHGKLYQLEEPQPDRLSLPAAHHETIVEFESDGAPRVFSLLAVAGLSNRPNEIGELVVAHKSDGELFEILSPAAAGGTPSGPSVAYRTLNDAGWFEFLDYDRANRRTWEARARRDIGADEAAYWRNRHAAVRRLIEKAPGVEVPQVAHPERAAAAIDRFIERKLEAENVVPAPPLDDLAFLRRVSLDVVGVNPAPREIEQFLADPDGERRARAIDRLLDDPRWADSWVGYWQHVLAENPGLTKPSLNNSGPFRFYLHEAFLDNKPLDRFASELVMMEGGGADGGPAGFAKATNNDVPMAHKAHIIGTAFLGVEMKCARCHDAPFHSSTQQDLFSLAALLAGKPIGVPESSSVPGTPEQLARMAVTVSLEPGKAVEPAWPFDEPRQATGDDPRELAPRSDRPRARLAALLVHPANRRFAEVFVNRLWQRYFGRGLVEPVHDWEGQEPSHAELLAWLADELLRENYDIKHVARLVLNSQAYQRSHDATGDREKRERLFAAAIRRRMTAEQLADSLFAGVGKPFDAEELCMNPDGRQAAVSFPNLGTPGRAWEFACTSNERERPSMTLPRAQSVVDLLMAFGWHQNRQEPINEREPEVTPLAPLVLANGEAASRAVDLAEHGALAELCLADQPVEELADAIVIRFLGRRPTPAERARYAALLSEGYESRQTGHAPAERRVDRSPLAWSNNLDADANRVGIERQHRAIEGDPPTRRLTDDWRERVEDLVWSIVNSPEFVFVP
jgi:hypothetical protein